MAQLEEPLLESAPLAWRLAPQLCRRVPETGESCAWYHGTWQVLRALDLVSTLRHHAHFYMRTLGGLARAGSFPRVLVSATADYSLPAHVIEAYRARQGRLELSVIDQCETPLALTRWYAERIGFEVATQRSSIFEYRAANPYDAICSHSFIGYFPKAGRPEVLSRWHSLLRPGGKLLTVNRIRNNAGDALVRSAPERIEVFSRTARDRARQTGGLAGIEPEAIAHAARVYAQHQAVVYPVADDELTGLFENSGFLTEQVLIEDTPLSGHAALNTPAASATARYAHVVATRL
jgi:SAM-dependent methyltransferase